MQVSDNGIRLLDTDFPTWTSLNDSIMGGSSFANCKCLSNRLYLSGQLVEEGGGFVSCRSNIFTPSMDLSTYMGLQLEIDGEGKSLKLAVSCSYGALRLPTLFYRGLKWVKSFPTNNKGSTCLKIPFTQLQPTIRAQKINFPLTFNASSIIQFQLLYSKFGEPGELNNDFCPGPISICLRSISAYS